MDQVHIKYNDYISGPPGRLIMLTSSGPSKRFITITISGSSRKIIIITSYRSIKNHGHGPRSPIKMLTIAPNQSKPYCIKGHIKSKVIPIFTETEVMKLDQNEIYTWVIT